MGGRQRLAWIDIARGLSITLVVLWHALPEPTTASLEALRRANEFLVYLRMPLFFFVAGLVATKTIALPWAELLRTRIAKLVWLFIVWSVICFALIDTVRDLVLRDGGPDLWRLARIFVDPPLTLWFIYALAIVYVIARLLRPLGAWIALPILGALYLWSVSSGDWRVTIPFVDRVARLALFFFLGLVAAEHMTRLAPRLARAWPLLLAAYGIMAAALTAFEIRSWGLLTFACSAIGILFAIGIACRLAETAPGRWLRFCGENSVYIYVMHRVPIAYLEGALRYARVQPEVWSALVVWVVALVVPLAVRPLLHRAGFGLLFDNPLTRIGRGRRPKPAMA